MVLAVVLLLQVVLQGALALVRVVPLVQVVLWSVAGVCGHPAASEVPAWR